MIRDKLVPVLTLFMAMGIVGAEVGTAIRANAAPSDDVAFLKALDDQGITYRSASKIIDAGHAVCMYRTLGYAELDVVSVVEDVTRLDSYNAGFFVGVSEAAYCPRFARIPGTGGMLA